MAVDLKTFQTLSYERLQGALSGLFGLHVSQDGLIEMPRRAETRLGAEREAALSALRSAAVVTLDERSVRAEGDPSARVAARSEFLNCSVLP